MSAINKENIRLSATLFRNLSAALAETAVFTLSKKGRIAAIKLHDAAGIAADNTNYVTITVKKGATTVATLDTRAANQGAVTANVAKLASLVAAEQDRAEGDTLTATVVLAGSGALTRATLQLDYHYL